MGYPRRSFYGCDLLTLLGMIGIFLTHLTHVLAGFRIIDYQTFPVDSYYNLQVAVVLFFLVSGFKIAASLDHSFRDHTFSYPRYLLRRFVSIWPLLMIAMISYLIFRSCLYPAQEKDLNAWSYLEQIFLLQGFNPNDVGVVVPGSWFIGCLWIFYLVAPLLGRFAKSSHRLLYVLAVSLLVRYLFSLTYNNPWFGLDEGTWNTYVGHCYVSSFPFFVLGFFIYSLAIRKDHAFKAWDIVPALGIIVYTGLSDSLFDNWSFWLALLLFLLSLIPTRYFRHCHLVPFLAKGALGTYLLQMLFLRTMALFYPYSETMDDYSKWWLTLAIVFPGLVLLSIGLYYGVERPVLKLTEKRDNMISK